MSPLPSNPSLHDTAPSARATTDVRWDEELDVVVLGYGGAGAAAAIEAAERGARTLVIERFEGGGATRLSGGIYYAGGGTDLQRAAGYEDTPEQLLEYLRCETEGEAVADEVLREFADRSVDNFEWLRARGVRFPVQSFPPIKTSYPSSDTTLYFSGNEKSPPYNDRAAPAPRGHRPIGPGLTGNLLFEPLRRAAGAAGVRVEYRTKATRLLTDDEGRVLGVEVRALSPSAPVIAIQRLLYYAATYGGASSPFVLKVFKKLLELWEQAFSTPRRIRARGGVVVSTGGFIYNPEWSARYLPRYHKTMRLGTIGDDGSGIALGQAIGGAVRKMERGTAWMFINPPEATCKGVLLDRRGERVCNEELYGAALGEAIAEHHDGRAILLLDRAIWEEARNELLHKRKAFFQSLVAVINLYVNNRKANTLPALEQKIGMPAGTLEQAVARYNAGVGARKDECGKSVDFLQPLKRGPFYAIDADIDNWKFLSPSISLGGLDVNGLTGAVKREDGSEIPGLFAAGRAAAGVCSQHYVSGLSIADGVFAGRKAGAGAALGGKLK
jgi:3-oxo-5alpha-steroid 4-dehydrogenase